MIGAGSGYWAWLMRQAGIKVAAFDAQPPPFTWSEVRQGDERAVHEHPEATLFLCWPPWATGMAFNALAAYRGDNADSRFFALLSSCFDVVDSVAIPQWYLRDDRLMVFRRRGPSATSGR